MLLYRIHGLYTNTLVFIHYSENYPHWIILTKILVINVEENEIQTKYYTSKWMELPFTIFFQPLIILMDKFEKKNLIFFTHIRNMAVQRGITPRRLRL